MNSTWHHKTTWVSSAKGTIRSLNNADPQITGSAFLGGTFAGGVVATAPVRCLERLELPDCRRLNQSALEWIAAGCTDLRSLNISGCALTKPEGIELLAASQPNLLQLGVAGCVELGGSTALSFVAERSGRCLRHLDISDIPAAGAAVVGKFLRNCGRLESINLSGLPNVNSSCFRGLGDQGRFQELENGTHLGGRAASYPRRQVNQSDVTKRSPAEGGCAHAGERSDFWDGAHRTPALPHLREARMLRLPSLDDVGIVRLANACPGLEDFMVSDSPLVTGACLAPLAFLCPRLRSLGLDRCGAASDEVALATACEGLPGLESLGIGVAVEKEKRRGRSSFHADNPGGGHTGSSGKSSRGIGGQHSNFRVSSGRAPYGGGGCADRVLDPPLPSSLPQSAAKGIRPLDNGHTVMPPFTGPIFLAAASRHCTRLTTLGLEGHESLTFSSEHSPAGAFPCLTELRLVGCAAVNDAGLLVLLGACPRVSSLSLSGSGVSHEALMGHASSSPNLSFVEVLPPVPAASPAKSSGDSRSTDSSSRLARTAGLPRKIAVAPPSPPLTPEEGQQQPGPLETDQAPMVPVTRGPGGAATISTNVTTPVAEGPGKGGCSTSSNASSLAVGRDGFVDSTPMMATGLRPTPHHKLHTAAAAVLTRFKEEQRALEILGRALRKFRDRRSEILASKARVICRGMLAYRFRTSDNQPDKVRSNNKHRRRNRSEHIGGHVSLQIR